MTAAPARRPAAMSYALIALAIVAWWTLLSPPWANDLVGGDEGYYGVMARNLEATPRQWPVPSLAPLGEAGDKPPGLPAMIALARWVTGAARAREVGSDAAITAVRCPSIVSAIVILFALALLARRLVNDRAGYLALLVLGTLPWFADAARVAAAEMPLTAFAMLALVAVAPARAKPPGRTRAFTAGALFGLAFLCKLWLVALLALPALALLWPVRARAVWLALIAGVLLPLLAHLALLAITRPDLLTHWRDVVFAFSLQSRASGSGFADYWFHGPLYYPLMLGKAFALWAPFLLVALWSAARAPGEAAARALWGMLAALALLCAFRVQSGGYALPLVPMLALFAAVGLERAVAAPKWQAAVWSLALLAALMGASRIGERLPQRYHRIGYREIAAAIAPYLKDAAGPAPRVLAPEAPVFAYTLGCGARYWDTPYDHWSPARFDSLRADTSTKAFVVDLGRGFYGGFPDEATYQWLSRETRDITGQVGEFAGGGRLQGFRVFVRR
jgi:4-amino-4-deoxy-L-arabinose transferase-like glycosyltransferase